MPNTGPSIPQVIDAVVDGTSFSVQLEFPEDMDTTHAKNKSDFTFNGLGLTGATFGSIAWISDRIMSLTYTTPNTSPLTATLIYSALIPSLVTLGGYHYPAFSIVGFSITDDS